MQLKRNYEGGKFIYLRLILRERLKTEKEKQSPKEVLKARISVQWFWKETIAGCTEKRHTLGKSSFHCDGF